MINLGDKTKKSEEFKKGYKHCLINFAVELQKVIDVTRKDFKPSEIATREVLEKAEQAGYLEALVKMSNRIITKLENLLHAI